VRYPDVTPEKAITEVRITKRVFDRLEPKPGEFTCWDGDIPGFGVRVRPSGTKSFVVMYRVGGQNSPLRKVTLGSGNKLTVEEARTEARKVLAKAELGASAGMGLTIVGRLLGHADVKTTNRYSNFDADPLRRAANTIGSTLAAAMGDGGTASAKILPMRRP
jgi:hypothetical protein